MVMPQFFGPRQFVTPIGIRPVQPRVTPPVPQMGGRFETPVAQALVESRITPQALQGQTLTTPIDQRVPEIRKTESPHKVKFISKDQGTVTMGGKDVDLFFKGRGKGWRVSWTDEQGNFQGFTVETKKDAIKEAKKVFEPVNAKNKNNNEAGLSFNKFGEDQFGRHITEVEDGDLTPEQLKQKRNILIEGKDIIE